MNDTTTQRIEQELNLHDPWKIVSNTLKTIKDDIQERHITISFTRGAKFKDRTGTPCPIHDTRQKKWQHFNHEKYRCYIFCKVPLIKTADGKTQIIDVPWARSGSRFSLAFEAEVMQKIKENQPLDTVGSLLETNSPRVWAIFNECITSAYETDIIDQNLSVISIDEILDQAKDKQATITIDLKNERVLRVIQGSWQEALQDIRNYLTRKGIPPEQIKHVNGPLPSDLQFSSDFKACFPNAEYHVDRLYITRLLNDAVDQIRKKKSYRTKKPTEARASFVKHPALLSEQQKNEVQELSATFSNVGQACRLKNTFFDLWAQPSTQAAEAFLASWCHEVSRTKHLSPLKHAAQQLKEQKQHIVLFLDLPTGSATMEKIHANILAATKRTKGLKNFENVSNMIYFCCGKLASHHISS